MEHRKNLVSLIIIAVVLFCCVSTARCDSLNQWYTKSKHNIRDHSLGTKECYDCLYKCYNDWAAQKSFISIFIADTSTGWDDASYPQQPYLLADSVLAATVDFEVFDIEDPDKIDMYLVNENYNPDVPEFGVLVGSDTNPADGWYITFDLDTYGTDLWCGFLVAVATFPDGPMDPDDPGGDGDAAAIFITRDAEKVPEPSVLGLLFAGGFLLKRRRAV